MKTLIAASAVGRLGPLAAVSALRHLIVRHVLQDVVLTDTHQHLVEGTLLPGKHLRGELYAVVAVLTFVKHLRALKAESVGKASTRALGAFKEDREQFLYTNRIDN